MATEVRIEPSLLDYMRRHSGAAELVVVGASDDAVRAALERAREGILALRHPEEPNDSFVSYVSDVRLTEGSYRVVIDAADAEAYDGIIEAIVSAVVDALRHISAPLMLTLTHPPIDARASTHAFDAVVPPPGAPPGFPLPRVGRLGTSGSWPIQLSIHVEVPAAPSDWFETTIAYAASAGYQLLGTNADAPVPEVARASIARLSGHGRDIILTISWFRELINGAAGAFGLSVRPASEPSQPPENRG